jgi:hypothetical protein
LIEKGSNMRASLSLFVLAAGLTFASAARADLAPPNSSQCQTKKAGDACTTDDSKSGSCVASKCSKLDYSDGTPPSTVQYDCLLCVAGGGADSGPADGGADSGTVPQDGGGGGGCSFASVATRIGPWAIALCVPLLLRRRRRNHAK